MQKYLNPTTLFEEATRRHIELCEMRGVLEKRMAGYPPGKIHIVNCKGRIQYYLRVDSKEKSGKYLSRSDEEMIKKFLQKKYDEETFQQVNSEIKNLEQFLSKSQNSITSLRNTYSNQPQEIKNQIIPIDLSDEDYISEWIKQPYDGKATNPEMSIYITDKGETVRSKSELNIANTLSKYGIPYKYECPFVLSGGNVIYPDFTVLNVRKRKDILWEHRGMMDDREYAKQSVQRIKQMEMSGVYLGESLIITEETNNSPLGTNDIKRIIKEYF